MAISSVIKEQILDYLRNVGKRRWKLKIKEIKIKFGIEISKTTIGRYSKILREKDQESSGLKSTVSSILKFCKRIMAHLIRNLLTQLRTNKITIFNPWLNLNYPVTTYLII